ncbi:TPA: hypothetical protein ACIUHN_002695, partial [Salmonella enterica subsp. diarizonae serovar 50:k:z35]
MGKTQKNNETSYLLAIARVKPAEVALAMLGFDCLDDDSILTKSQRKEFDKLKTAITRNLQIVETKPSFNNPYD